MKALVSKELPLAVITAMPPEDQNGLACQYMKGRKAIKEDQDTQKESAKVIGKVCCALEIRLNAGIKAMAFPANKSLAEFFKDITGEKPPTHVLTLKNVYGAFVETRLITENDYDVCSGNCLELAGQIVKAVNGDLTHQAVSRAAAHLKERGDKAAKSLREILATVKPATKLTPKEALENFQKIADDGQLAVCIAEMPDIVLRMPDDAQKDIYVTFAKALERFDTAIGDQVDAWAAEMDARHNAAEAKVVHLQAGVPAPVETPEEVPQAA